MRRRLTRGVVVLAVLCAAGMTARADDRFGVGVKAGTLGAGVDLTIKFTNWFDLRPTLNQANLTKSFSQSDVDYDGDFKLGASGVLLDFHPFRNKFRLTAGILSNRTKIELHATPTQDVTIGDTTYTPAQVGVLTGDMKFRSTVSYFGIGYGSAARGPHRLGFVFDAGVMPEGEAEVSLTSSGSVTQADLQQEEQNIKDDTKSLKAWPVLAFGISIRL